MPSTWTTPASPNRIDDGIRIPSSAIMPGGGPRVTVPPAHPESRGVPVATGPAVQSVDRAIDLLETMADLGGDATLSDLASASQLPMPTIHRLLRTLVHRGYARQLPSRRYGLGPRLARLGEVSARQFGAGTRANLERLAGELGESVNLALRDGD